MSESNTLRDNVDSAEVAKFNALAARWWDPEGDFRPLHEINPLRLDWIRQHGRPFAGKKVVDIGCGGGILAEAMASKPGATVTGIDMAEAPLSVARLHQIESGIRGRRTKRRPPRNWPSVSAGLLRHRDLPRNARARPLARRRRPFLQAQLARPGGDIFFSTINRNPKSFLFAIVGAEYVLKLLPAGTHEYQKFIRPSELDANGRGMRGWR